MGYTLSRRAIERMKKVLDEAVRAPEGSKLIFNSAEPNKLQYAIRTAFKSVARYPKSYPEYVELEKRFAITTVKGAVVLLPRDAAVPDPLVELAESANRMTIETATNLFEVVGAALKHPQMLELAFPNASFSTDNLTRLYNWAETNDYIICKVSPLTITKNFNEHTPRWKPQN